MGTQRTENLRAFRPESVKDQGDYEAAIASYQRALDLDPNFVNAQNNLAEAQRLLELGNAPVFFR